MLKFIAANSGTIFIVYVANFFFKAYLTHIIESKELIAFSIFMDFNALLLRSFVGYKDLFIKLNIGEDKERLIALFSKFIFLVSILFSTVLVPGFYFLNQGNIFQGLNVPLILLICVCISVISQSYMLVHLYLKRDYYTVNYSEIIKLLSFLIFSLSFLQVMDGVLSLLYAVLFSNVITTLFAYVKLRRDEEKVFILCYKEKLLSTKSGGKFLWQIFNSSLPYFMWALFMFSPVYVLILYGESRELADYQVVARSILFALISIIVWPVNRILFPELANLVKIGDVAALDKIRKNITMISALLLMIAFPVFVFLSPYVIEAFFEKSYIGASYIINILFLTIPIQTFSSYFIAMIKIFKGFEIISLVYLLGIISFLLFSWIFRELDYYIHYSFISSLLLQMCTLILIFNLTVDPREQTKK